MTAAAEPELEEGRVYRTKELARWTSNPPRLARRLVAQGQLIELARGLYARPYQTRWGAVIPNSVEVMRAFLEGSPFVFTGPGQWNALGLGTTALSRTVLVYNRKRSETLTLGGQTYVLRRVAFPVDPPPEWFVVDLFEHAEQAAASRPDVARALTSAVAAGVFDRERLLDLADRYGTNATRKYIQTALHAVA
jgi:hypothetical protein